MINYWKCFQTYRYLTKVNQNRNIALISAFTFKKIAIHRMTFGDQFMSCCTQPADFDEHNYILYQYIFLCLNYVTLVGIFIQKKLNLKTSVKEEKNV